MELGGSVWTGWLGRWVRGVAILNQFLHGRFRGPAYLGTEIAPLCHFLAAS